MRENTTVEFSRRTLTVGAVGAALALGWDGKASAQSEPSAASPVENGMQADGTWTFTDDRGRVASLPKKPERVIAFVTAGSALWDLGIQPIGIFGSVHRADGSLQPSVGSIDLATVEIISEEYWATDLEAFVAIRPDLIVTTSWDPTDATSVWGIGAELVTRAEEIAPIVAIGYGPPTPLLQSFDRFEELATALGADLSAAEVVANEEAFDAAVEKVKLTIAAKSELTSLWVAGSTTGLWLCGPKGYSDLAFFAELGLEIVDLEGGTGVDEVSWEVVGSYRTDVIFNDARETGAYFTPEQLMKQPTFASLPAAQTGQIENWYYEYVLSRKGFTFNLTELAAALNRTEIII